MSFFPGPFPGFRPIPGSGPDRTRIPRGGVDPILCADDALAVITGAIHQPLVDETLILAVDSSSRCSTVTIVRHAAERGLCDTLERLGSVADFDGAVGIVAATVRPRGATRPGDVDEWLDTSALAELWGLVLFEWFVICPFGIECPRDLIGEPERWWPLAS